MLFKLNWGTHNVTVDGEARCYKAGDVIESESMLDQAFPVLSPKTAQWKFTLLNDPKAQTRPEIPTVVRSPSKPVEGLPEQRPSTDTTTVAVEGEDPATWYQQNVTPNTENTETGTDGFDKYGEDVTKEFERATPQNLQVRFDGTRYRVLNTDSKIVNGIKKLATPKDVRIFLKHYEPQV